VNIPRRVRTLLLFLVLPLLLLLPACAGAHKGSSSTSGLSSKLTPFTYYDEGKLLFIGADTRAAEYIKDESIFPLGIAVTNKTLGILTVDRESFTIEDEDGNRYPLASYEEYRSGYSRSNTDDRLADNFVEAMRGRFATFTPETLSLFPNTGSARNVTETKQIGRRRFAMGYVYFPVPATGLHDKTLRLLFRVKEYPDTFVVRFSVR